MKRLILAALFSTLLIGPVFAATQFGPTSVALIQVMSDDFPDAGHPGGILFTTASMPASIQRFIIRSTDSALEMYLATIQKARELGKTIYVTYNVDPANSTNGIVVSLWY